MPCTSILRETSLYTERHKVTVHLLRVRVFCGKKVKEKVRKGLRKYFLVKLFIYFFFKIY